MIVDDVAAADSDDQRFTSAASLNECDRDSQTFDLNLIFSFSLSLFYKLLFNRPKVIFWLLLSFSGFQVLSLVK